MGFSSECADRIPNVCLEPLSLNGYRVEDIIRTIGKSVVNEKGIESCFAGVM